MSNTPGPWRIARRTPFTIILASDSVYATPPDTRSMFMCEIVTDGEDDAESNAQLICAAPNLLQAAQRLIAALNPMKIGVACDPAWYALIGAVAAATSKTQDEMRLYCKRHGMRLEEDSVVIHIWSINETWAVDVRGNWCLSTRGLGT